MRNYDSVVDILKQNGLKDTDNICEFWFENRNELMPIIYGPAVHDDTFSLQVRWKSPIGLACLNAVKEYIENTTPFTEETIQVNNLPEYFGYLKVVNFDDFNFEFENHNYNLNQFALQFETSQHLGTADLRGINFSQYLLYNCIIYRTDFSCSNFDNCTIIQVRMIDSWVANVSFQNSHLGSLWLENTKISGADFDGAFINCVEISDETLSSVPFQFRKVSYWWLLKMIFKKLTNKNFYVSHSITRCTHTNFLSNSTNRITINELKHIKEYIEWYQEVIYKIDSLYNAPLNNRIGFILSLITTKSWTSYLAFAIFTLVINLIFSLAFYLGHSNFNYLGVEINTPNFLQSFYYSVVTFTTLGYGDITPNSAFGQILVIINVITGYFTLGIFVFLISRKIERNI